MKTPGSRPPHDTLQTALRSAFPLDARRLVVFTALVLAVIQARTVVLYSLKTHVTLPGTLTARYQRLCRFVQFSFPEGLFPRWPGPKVWTVSSRDSAQEQGTTRDFLAHPGEGMTDCSAAPFPQRRSAARPLACWANSSGVR